MGYNFESFEKLIFSVPSTYFAASIIFIASSISALFFSYGIGGILSLNSVGTLFSLFLIANLVPAEFMPRVLKGFPRNWNYLITTGTFLNFSVTFLVLEKILGGANLAFLIAAGLAFTLNHVVYVIAAGNYGLFKLSIGGILYPVLLFSSIYLLLLRFKWISIRPELFGGLLLLLAASMTVNKLVNEHLFQVNSLDIPGAPLASKVLMDTPSDLDLGTDCRVPVRTIEIKNQEDESFRAFAPWIHPGPLASFGGSRITGDSIDEESKTFFYHLPSTHESDITLKDDADRVIGAMDTPLDWSSTASELQKIEDRNFTVHGRAYGDRKVIYLESDRFDDYDRAIFSKYLDREDITIMDTHGGDRVDGRTLRSGMQAEDDLEQLIEEMIERLENAEQFNYRAGWEVRERKKSLMALVEEVGDERTLVLGVNENERSGETDQVEDEYSEGYDNVIVFTTDDHRSIYDQAIGYPNDFQDYQDAVKVAEESVSDTELGVKLNQVENVRLLKNNYHDLMGSLNIMIRTYPITVLWMLLVYIVAVVLLV